MIEVLVADDDIKLFVFDDSLKSIKGRDSLGDSSQFSSKLLTLEGFDAPTHVKTSVTEDIPIFHLQNLLND